MNSARDRALPLKWFDLVTYDRSLSEEDIRKMELIRKFKDVLAHSLENKDK